ncbi:hypothetical protein RDABS01_000573 [Bienertia sinuspersici]
MLQQPFSFTTNFSSLLHSPKTSLPYLNDGFNVYELFSGDQGDSSSAEEVESPRSVVTAASLKRRSSGRRWPKSRHHNNNKENNNNGKTNNNNNINTERRRVANRRNLMGDFGIFNVVYVAESHPLDDVSSTKIILPASPLGTKKNY